MKVGGQAEEYRGMWVWVAGLLGIRRRGVLLANPS